MRILASLTTVPFVLLVACSGATSTSDGASESEVNVAQCPTEIRVELGKPKLYAQTAASAAAFSKDELTRLEAASTEAGQLGVLQVKVGGLVKEADTCRWSAGDTEVVLRTNASGSDRLEIKKGKFSAWAYPQAFSPAGIRFANDTVVWLYAHVEADPGGDRPMLSVRIGDVSVRAIGEQIPAPPATTLRVPVLDDSGQLVNPTNASFPKTIVLDPEKGSDDYRAIAEQAEEANFELMRFASPSDYITQDEATSLCFDGPSDGVCDLMTTLTDNLFSDMFSFAENDSGRVACDATADSVSMTFYMSESDSTGGATIPRCKK